MIILDGLQQGSQEWLDIRMNHFNASEAPMMMGESKFFTRNQLLDHKKGWITEINEHTQRLFDKGHAVEQAALPLAEAIIDDELYPKVGVLEDTKFLASFDGATLLDDVLYEHKLFNKVLSENVLNGLLTPEYYWQLEHQLLVSGAEKVIFVCSDGTKDKFYHTFYESVPERRAQLIAGWEQFEKDLATHELKAKTEKVIADKPADLPAITYEMNGLSLVSNLDEFKVAADELVVKANGLIETDQDFADAEVRQKLFTKAEKEIKELQEKVLNEVADISAFTKDLKYIGEQIRQARLAESKQIKSRKEEIKNTILMKCQGEVHKLTSSIMNAVKAPVPDIDISISEAMKGKKTIDSLENAADTALAQIKIKANELADIARANIDFMADYSDYKFLFSDWASIAYKANDDFQALVKSRIADHKAEEEKRLEAQREAIRQEERAKAEREAQAKLKAEQDEIARIEQQAKMEQQRAQAEQAKQEQPKAPELANAKSQTTPINQVHADKEVTPALTDYQKGYVQALKDTGNENLINEFLNKDAA